MVFVFSSQLTFSLALDFPGPWLIAVVGIGLRTLGFSVALISLYKEGWVHSLRELSLYSDLES